METGGHGTVTTTDNTTGPKAIVFIKKARIESQLDPMNSTTTDSQNQ